MENSALQSDRHEPGAASADEEVSVPLDNSTKRTLRLCPGVIALGIYWLIWRFGLRGAWGQWSMRAQMAAAVIPAFFILLWVPVVWASLRWMLRDFIRAQKAPLLAKHAKEPSPFVAAFSFVFTAGILAFVASRAWGSYGLAVQDWWDGPTRHENVSCQNVREEGDETFLKRANKTFVIFDLVGADGYSQHFELRVSDLEKEMEREDSPYITIMTLCEAQAAGFGVSVYERTGIVNEAWKTN